MAAVNANPVRVLCAEDNRFFREAVTGVLASAGHRVLAAEDGQHAWDILSEKIDQIDVVITDHQMPGLTGLEFVQRLRQTAFFGRIYVYSSVLKPAEEEAYRRLRVDRIFTKNVPLEELLRAVETAPSQEA